MLISQALSQLFCLIITVSLSIIEYNFDFTGAVVGRGLHPRAADLDRGARDGAVGGVGGAGEERVSEAERSCRRA